MECCESLGIVWLDMIDWFQNTKKMGSFHEQIPMNFNKFRNSLKFLLVEGPEQKFHSYSEISSQHELCIKLKNNLLKFSNANFIDIHCWKYHKKNFVSICQNIHQVFWTSPKQISYSTYHALQLLSI